MTSRKIMVLVGVASLFAGLVVPAGIARQASGPVKVVQLTGVNGKVRFFGGNLKATYDFAKKAAHVANENFSTPGRK